MTLSKLRVGIIGCGEVTQVIHLPVLSLLSHLYSVQVVCDISKRNAEHCAERFHVPYATIDPTELICSPYVDVVFILTSDEFHETYTIAALEQRKHVMLEKPVTLSIASAERILKAEEAAGGAARVFVGYMRRYARSFTQAFKREVASIPRILYARSRDFSGPNAQFVSQSGTFQVKNTDFPPGSAKERKKKLDALLAEALDGDVSLERTNMCRFLGSLGSHDISLMRETLGFPESVLAVSANHPFYSAIFNMRRDGHSFATMYESGIDEVPMFDAHLAVYGERKRVSIQYDSPYVKGLPIMVNVEEVNEHGEMTTRKTLSSYEDAYTTELQELHACLMEGKEIKTTVHDALQDLKLFDMMYKALETSQSSVHKTTDSDDRCW